MFMRITESKRKQKYFPKKASTAFAIGDLVDFVNGEVQPATSTSTRIAGVCMQTIAATDTDYAAETPICIELIDPNAEFEADVTGTLTTESVGIQYDLVDAKTVNAAATTHKMVTCTEFMSATKGKFIINSAFQYVPGV